ncbi:MAG TPA: DUF6580 family putative transport protein [Candidatus Polarisedimenticolia bacterium]|nr:DUF6580 family putative transport protein [Candidatus Polarisedimenticolia bacterium]
MLPGVKEKWSHTLPYIFMALFAVSRWPGLFPPSFSMAYALVFCAGVFLSKRMAWWLPLGTLVLTDIALNFYYQSKGWDVWKLSTIAYQSVNYVAYALIILLAKRFKPRSSFMSLLGGGLLGALLFYVVTNASSWLFNPFDNPEYNKRGFLALLLAIIKGTHGWPDAWMFFRNTMLSGGLFTALFVGALKLTAPAESPLEKEGGARAPESEPTGEETPEEARA